jgi:hypothetical protein
MVARHEMPGKRITGARPVGNGMIDFANRPCITLDDEEARRRESYRTLRDGSLDGPFPGISCLATIIQPLGDKSLPTSELASNVP